MSYPIDPKARAAAKPGVSLATLKRVETQATRTQTKETVRTVVHEVHHHHPAKDRGASMSNYGGSPFTNPFQVFEALAKSDDRTPITTAGLGPMLLASGRWLPQPLVNFNRLMLASISEYLYDNFGQVSYAVDSIANYSVPVMPLAATDDPDTNEIYNAYFKDWTRRADVSGRFNFSELQELACKGMDKQGDHGFIMVSENGFPQLQTIEGWQIGALKVGIPDSMRIIDGVMLDEKGAVAGYVVQSIDGPIPVSSNVMKLLYEPDRFHGYRGLTPIRRGANDARDSRDLQAFEKKAAKLKAAMAAVIEGGPIEENAWGTPQGDGFGTDGAACQTGEDPGAAGPGISIADLMGGDIPVLPAGRVLKFLANNSPGTNSIEFFEVLAGFFSAGVSLPAAFLSDQKLTGPNVRAVLGKAQKKFSRRSWRFADFGTWTWERVIGDGIQKRTIPAHPNFAKVTHQFPARLSIDLGDQAGNDRQDVQSGQMTRQERFGNRALDWQLETDQTDRELDYIFQKAEKQSKKYGIPIDTVLAAYGVGQTSKIPSSPAPQNEQLPNDQNPNK